MKKVGFTKYYRYSWFLVGAVFLVILAGGLVRMTQSGMGCPDWPKCFGLWIPPINASQLPDDYESYLSLQDIDHSFNVYHTWIEYINRLLGALLGIFVFIYLIWSFRIRKSVGIRFFYTALVLFFLTGFQGWLGKVVVEENLAVSKITIHMLVAILIVCLPIINIRMFDHSKIVINRKKWFIPIVLIALVIVQVILGTQVREEIDVVSKALDYGQREQWIAGLGTEFVVHRSFSWALLIVSASLLYFFKRYIAISADLRLILFLLLSNISLGIIMSYLNMPAIIQPLHLVFACLLVVSLFNLILKLNASKRLYQIN